MLYAFKGLDGFGKTKKGNIEASGLKEAKQKLKKDGIYVTGIDEERVAKSKLSAFKIFAQRVSGKEIASFFRQTASLVDGGIPLMETLTAIQKENITPHLKKVINELRDGIRQGKPMAESMEKHSELFDTLSISMVRAGESGGNLAEVLEHIADYKEESLRRESTIKSAAAYPVAMAIFGIGVILFLVGYVVPKITVIFEDLEQALPLSTEILIFATGILNNYGYLIATVFCLLLIALSQFLKTDKGKRTADIVMLKPPIIGSLVKSAILARWSHTASVLLSSGVPILLTLKLSGEVAGNVLYKEALKNASDSIREGGAIAPALEKSGLFPPVTIQMVSAGEKSGEPARLLAKLAKEHSMELENSVSTMMSFIQPLLISILGLVVGFIVMAILLPIFEISQFIG